jgi:hypothetical protein
MPNGKQHQFQTMQASQRSPMVGGGKQNGGGSTQDNFKGLIEHYYTQSHQVKVNYMTQKEQLS